MKFFSRIVSLCCVCSVAVLGLASCIVNTNVRAIPYDPNCETLYVLENLHVHVADFIPLMTECANRHGLKVQLIPEKSDWTPHPSDYVVEYTVRRRMALGMQLAYADVNVRKGNVKIASCHYSIPRFSMSFDIYDSTEEKMTPLFEELFENYSAISKPRETTSPSAPRWRDGSINDWYE